ncbi:MAG: oxygen-independent coproporphyrinogen III oxidase, partial [Promethearchaeota archaeon CR_4]
MSPRMRGPDLYYREPVYRPPSEAYSLLIQATIGCSYRCTFCLSNLTKDFSIRPTEDIKRD